MNRRRFIASMAIQLPVLAGLKPLLVRGESKLAENLPAVRQITKGPKFHWFGYYDKLQFSADNRLVLGNEVDFEGRSPKGEDRIRVGMVDLHDNDRWTELGSTRAWNWQQGCMLQWLPGSDNEVIWNDREGNRFVSRILKVKTGKLRTLPNPIYTISPDGKTAIAPDFRRLNDCRPGYGYAGLDDPNRNITAPKNAGIWRMDMKSGRQKLLFSFADAVKVPFTGREESAFLPGAKHWFNHLLFNTDGTRFFFLHRWRNPGQPITKFQTRAFTCNRDGKDWYCLDPHGGTSHFIWRDPDHIMAWAWHPSHGDKFYLYKDRTDEVTLVGLKEMSQNGHNTYLPNMNNEWVLNDTYPDKQRDQHPYLYHLPSKQKVPLGHFRTPSEYAGEWRCDTHPRSSRDGKLVCIDSPHEGGRQMFLIDLKDLIG
ncbi:MAG: hypothetical protein ABIP71_13425 [Verrucomicrobiota bacterium]